MRILLVLLLAAIVCSNRPISFDSESQIESDSMVRTARILDKEMGGCARIRAVVPGVLELTNFRVSYRKQEHLQVSAMCTPSEVPIHTHTAKEYPPEYLCSPEARKTDELTIYSRYGVRAAVIVCGIGPDSIRAYGPDWDMLLTGKDK